MMDDWLLLAIQWQTSCWMIPCLLLCISCISLFVEYSVDMDLHTSIHNTVCTNGLQLLIKQNRLVFLLPIIHQITHNHTHYCDKTQKILNLNSTIPYSPLPRLPISYREARGLVRPRAPIPPRLSHGGSIGGSEGMPLSS